MAENKKEKWIEVGTLITIMIPMFYTAGWSYAYHYFDCFHLGLIGLDIPKEYLFVYSFWVVKNNLFMFCLIFMGAGGVYFSVRYLIRKNIRKSRLFVRMARFSQALCVVLTPMVILSMFWIFYYFGDTAAHDSYDEQCMKDFVSYPRVRVWVKPNTENGITGAMVREWQKGCYRLLLRNKDNLYVFYPLDKGDKTPTDIIPMSKIEGVRVLPVYESCR